MRLLYTEGDYASDGLVTITLREFPDGKVPPYAILSHRWREEEVTFTDMMATDPSQREKKLGWAKIEKSCRVALRKRLRFCWIDTCCIDKGT
jgi:hypothetical protein